MSQDAEYKPLSLAQHFEPPEHFSGYFAWMCGYSADSSFLSDAIERFTGYTATQRAYMGRAFVALILDAGNEQIAPIEVPGLVHLPVKSPNDLPFKLLHAKVAILGFRHETDAKQWRLKLIVSTGNWTRGTLEDSLDLMWCTEIGSKDVTKSDEAKEKDAADIAAAWKSMQWLVNNFDTRVLQPAQQDPKRANLENPTREVRKWLRQTKKYGKRWSPRFVDNRTSSLLAQLPDKIANCSRTTPRNYLAMGSGFYESTSDTKRAPSVLKRIVDELKEKSLLTKNVRIEIYVNPKACQAVATSMNAINNAGWSIYAAIQPSYFSATIIRSLHAKFIFGCSYRGNNCNLAWLYLGSGNLTRPGFANSMNRSHGNFEAGVVFSPQGLKREDDGDTLPESILSNRLPIDSSDEYIEPASPNSGDDMPERESFYAAAPIAYLYWTDDKDEGWLTTDVTVDEQLSFELLDATESPCDLDKEQGFRWKGVRPRQVKIRWSVSESSVTSWIPVIDEYGRLAATVLPRIDILEAWEQLENFPMPPEDEDLREEGTVAVGQASDGDVQKKHGKVQYPVRQMMQLVENIAAKQNCVQRLDWPLWCRRFEQCLTQASESEVINEFVKLNINPLSPLKHKPFRPKFAEDEKKREGMLFESALERIQIAWGVTELPDLGGEA
jgi:hypothetical protein